MESDISFAHRVEVGPEYSAEVVLDVVETFVVDTVALSSVGAVNKAAAEARIIELLESGEFTEDQARQASTALALI